MVGIYEIRNKVNNKRYIGQSNFIEDRLSHHRSELRNHRHGNNYLQNAWNKYGEESFEFNIIEECTEESLNEKEIFWINHYKTFIGFNDCQGYNLTSGGDDKFETFHPVLQFDLYGNFIKEYDNGYRAAEATKINVSSIYGCITKRLKRAGKYIWIYKEDYTTDQSLQWYLTDRRLDPVEQYDLYGNLIKVWDSVSQIIDKTGENPINCLVHNSKTFKGYIYKYISDPLIISQEYCSEIRKKVEERKNKEFMQLDIDGNIIKEYSSIREAARDGWSQRMISECLSGTRVSYKKYLWVPSSEIDEYNPDICRTLLSMKITPTNHAIIQYNLDGTFVKEYKSLAEVSYYGFCKSNVRDCCVGHKKQYKGFLWKYKE